MRVPLALFALVLGQAASEAAAGIRVALWSDQAGRDEAAALAAELSTQAGGIVYEVLDRDELARVVAEQAREGTEASAALRAGRLLGAEGVVWIDGGKIEGRTRRMLRLSAADSGLIAGWWIDEATEAGAADWAAQAARRLAAWQPRLTVPQASARAVSLMNLRRVGVVTGEGGIGREQALTLLLGQALANDPRLRVLERWRLDDLALETVLGGQASDAFWQGAALVDGSFSEAGGEIAVSLRLRSAGVAEVVWTMKGRDAGELIARVATEIARRLLSEPSEKVWDRAAEAGEFLEEARWAARWNLHQKVVEAAEAAIALGGAKPELRRLRYLARGRLVWGGREPVVPAAGALPPTFVSPGLGAAGPALERLAAAKQALDLFKDHRALRDGRAGDSRPAGPAREGFPGRARPVSRAELDAMELLGGAAKILGAAYRTAEIDAATGEAVVELRHAARETFEREYAALDLRSRPRRKDASLPAVERGGPYISPAESLLLVGCAHGALWTERLADHQEFVAGLLAAEVEGEPGLFDQLLRLISAVRADAWEVDWSVRDGAVARARWEAKAREWMKSPERGLAFAGAKQLLALNPPLGIMPANAAPRAEFLDPMAPMQARFGSREEQEARVVEVMRFLASRLDDLKSGRIPTIHAQELVDALQGRVPESACEAWVEALEKRGATDSPALAEKTISARLPLTSAQKNRLLVVSGGESDAPRRELKPTAVAPRARQTKIPVSLHWLAPEARVPASGLDDYVRRRGIRWAERKDGRVRVITEETAGNTREPRFRLTEIELAGFRERRLGEWARKGPRDFNDHNGFPAFAVLGGHVFSWEGGELWRREVDGSGATRLALPVTGLARLWGLGGWLYVASNEGGILRVKPDSGAWEVLADSRRRPAQGPLDDCRSYETLRMWLGADGKPRACVTTQGEQVYRLEGAGGGWALEAKKPHANLPGFRYQRAECLAWLQDIEPAASGHGTAELDRLEADVVRAGDWRRPKDFSPGTYFAGVGAAPVEGARAGLAWMRRLGGMTRRGDVWMVYHFPYEPRRSPRVVRIPAEATEEIVCAEMSVPESLLTHLSVNPQDMLYGGIGGGARLLDGPEGLVIYAEKAPVLWFIPKESLESAGLAWGN